MPDAPRIDAHQARLYAEVQQHAREQVVRHALHLLAPGVDVTRLTYREVLERLMVACAAERGQETALPAEAP